MRMRALLLLSGIAVIAVAGFAQDAPTPADKSAAEPGSSAHQIATPLVPSTAASAKEEAAGPPAETKKQRIRYTFPPASAKRM